ncbi:MAG: TIR domain-containing protein [Candidatus Taylorbacteria bacterium]|nr:TIR domain-containing protein [Candidatus Taylorbacteria bacterium]
MKRIFISFAIEDRFARDNLVHQSENQRAPFEFVDMSVKTPWDSSWKIRCRERIRGCDGVIAFVSNNTFNADGARWEIQCAYEEGIRVLPIYVHDSGASRLPSELSGRKVYHWTWINVNQFIDTL